MSLGEDLDPLQAAESDVLRPRLRTMADTLAPLAARLLTAAAEMVAERCWHDLPAHGDRVLARPDNDAEDAWDLEDSFFFHCRPCVTASPPPGRLARCEPRRTWQTTLRTRSAAHLSLSPLETCSARSRRWGCQVPCRQRSCRSVA